MLCATPLLAGCPKNTAVQVPAVIEAPTEATPSPLSAVLLRPRQFFDWYQTKNFQALFDNSAKPMQQALPIEAWSEAHTTLDGVFGSEGEVLNENAQVLNGMTVYTRLAIWSKSKATTHIVINADGALEGFRILPVQEAAESPYLEYQTKIDLRLPFENEWMVVWGGRTVEKNYHAAYPDQRFALDLLIMQDGKSFKTDGKTNEDYYAFSKPVLAPGDGVVIASENSIIDNVPGEMNPEQAMGNHVIIDHGNDEYSFLAHFKQGTVTVAVGDLVKSGQQLGECGNSGNTSEAHIHYHLQDTGEFGGGKGLPIQFQNYNVDGEPVERGEVEQGQQISP